MAKARERSTYRAEHVDVVGAVKRIYVREDEPGGESRTRMTVEYDGGAAILMLVDALGERRDSTQALEAVDAFVGAWLEVRELDVARARYESARAAEERAQRVERDAYAAWRAPGLDKAEQLRLWREWGEAYAAEGDAIARAHALRRTMAALEDRAAELAARMADGAGED